MRTRHAFVALIVVVGVLATGCSWTEEDTRSATAGLPDLRQRLTAQNWVLDAADSSLTTTSGTTTLVFDPAGLVSGNGACNTYRGPFAISGDDLDIGPLAQTRMACADEAMRAEAEYVAALEAVRTADTTDRDRLVLKGHDGVRLEFSAFDAREAIAGEWIVTNLATGDALVAASTPEPRLTIGADGSLTAVACNTMNGDWTLENGRFAVGSLSSTLMACDQPLMTQEAALSTALEAASGVEVAPGKLTLLGDDGRILLVATPMD